MAIAASVEHPGAVIGEAEAKGWKGQGALDSVAGKVSWTGPEQKKFAQAFSAGKKSLPVLVGKEMGLLFEIMVFEFLVTKYGLKPVGGKDLAFAQAEKTRLVGEITSKVGAAMSKLVVDFIGVHAGGGPDSMAELIYAKGKSLIRECVMNAIEFTGGADWGTVKLKSDTADLRVGCEQYLPGMRADVGFSLKAVTETEIEVRAFGGTKTARLLGAGSRAIANLKAVMSNPLYDEAEKRKELMDVLSAAATANFANKPRKFAALLEMLVTGGADTIPAYKNLVRDNAAVGWSGAIGKDFVTGEGPGRKVGAKVGSSPVIDVKTTPTYVRIVYNVTGGNHYGTSVKFEPSGDGSRVSVVVSNLVSKGGRGY